MTPSMNKRERLQATIAGERVDRPAVSLWRHWPGDDQRAEDLAAAHRLWQQLYDFDFIKVMPSSAYCLQDWGVETAWQAGDEGNRHYLNRIINEPADWLALPMLDPNATHLAEARRTLEVLRGQLGEDTPIIMTIFSPLSQARNLAGAALLPQLRRHTGDTLAGFEVITESIMRFIDTLKPTGIDGVFYAAQWADAHHLSREEYERFGRPYDLAILNSVRDLWFNLLHIHGLEVYFDLFTDYPVQAINWHDRESGPTLAEGKELFPGAVSGGVNRWTMHRGTPEEVKAEAADAIAQTGGRRLILSTGCVVMTNTPLSNLRAARASVDKSSDSQ